MHVTPSATWCSAGYLFFHVFGSPCGLNAAIKAGAAIALLPRVIPGKALEILERDRVTIFEGVPTMYMALLNHPERAGFDVSALRACITGGAAMPVEVMIGFEKEFRCVVLEGYGLSETSPAASFNHSDARVPGSIGTPSKASSFESSTATTTTWPPASPAKS